LFAMCVVARTFPVSRRILALTTGSDGKQPRHKEGLND
jgi:hypothetical protein